MIKNNRSAGNYFFVTSKEELTAQHLFAGGVFCSGGCRQGPMQCQGPWWVVAVSWGSPKVSTVHRHRQIRVPRDCGGTNVVLPPSQRQQSPTRLDGTPAMLLPAAADASWCQEQSGGTQGQGKAGRQWQQPAGGQPQS